MKKTVFLLFLSTFILWGYSCSNEDNILTPQSEGELHEVAFKISNFTYETSEITTRSGLSDSNIKYLRYVVYNRDPAHPDLEKEVVQSNTLEGTDLSSPIELKLKKGSYRISIFASERPIKHEKIRPHSGSLGTFEPIETIIIEDITNPNKFQGSVDFDVNDTDILETIELKRCVGKITLAISDLDKAPSEVKTIIPILCSTEKTYYREGHHGPIIDSVEWARLFAPSHNILHSGATVFDGVSPDHPHLYSDIYIERSKFNSINEENPLSFYMMQNIKVNYNVIGMDPTNPPTYDLYLQGSKTDKIERQYIWHPTEPIELKNPDVVFMVRIKSGIVIKPNEQITIKGSLFKDEQGFDIIVDKEWGTNNDHIIDQPL